MFEDLKPSPQDSLPPLQGVPVSTETESQRLRSVKFEPVFTFNAFGRLLIGLSDKLPRSPSSVNSDVDRLRTNGEHDLISKRLRDVGNLFIQFDRALENKNIKAPDIMEYANSTFDGATLTTEPRIRLQKVCDYLSDFLSVFSQGTPIIDKNWKRADITELLYLLGVDATIEPSFSQTHQHFSQVATEAGVTLSGRDKEAKTELWNYLEERLSDGLKYQIEAL